MDRRTVNVILLGFGFMFVFTAFQTIGNIEKTVLDSIAKEDKNYHGDGFTSLAVIYAVFAVCNWAAPSIISVIGPRAAMVCGALTYALFIATFLFPSTWLLYVGSVVIGFGAAIIWTGQGNYLTLNSDPDTISRNSGLFWAMLQCSMFLGNLFVTFAFEGKTHIDYETRKLVFSVLLGVAGVGLVFVLLLRPAIQDAELEKRDSGSSGPLHALKRALQLACSKEMILLSVTFFYTGIELSFFSGVYSPSIGATIQMGENVKQLVGLSGIFIGVGEVIGGALFGLLGGRTTRSGRDPIVMIGFLIHVSSFFLIFLNLPNNANFGDTTDTAYISPNQFIAVLCSFLLGFGDSCFNTQIFSILGGIYPDDSAPAFALFKFTQSVAAAASFFYSSHIGLYIQLAILVVLATLGTVTFCVVEWADRFKRTQVTVNSESSDPDSASPRTPALPQE